MSAVRVVLLNWNERESAESCLSALRASQGVEPDVLVVDNGSAGGDAAHFRALVGQERVLALGENTGYAGGMNAGLAFWRSRPDDAPVLVITPDARVAPDTIGRLVAELEAEPDVGIVGPVVVYSRESGRLGAGGRIEPGAVRAPLLGRADGASPYDVDWIDGCCMLIRRSVLAALPDGFDERFFIYFEETDFCRRARESGWRVRVVPDAVVDHPKSEGTLPPYYFYYMVRNRYLFWEKNFGIGFGRVAARVAWATARSWGSVAKSLLRAGGRPEVPARLRDARLQLRGAWAGTRDHLRRRYGPMPESTMRRAAR